MWQKLIAGAFVMTGALGFGWSLCREMSCEVQELKAQKQILLYLIGEISYLHRPVEEILDIVSEKVGVPYAAFLEDVSRKLRERSGRGLERLWQEGVNGMRGRAELSETSLCYLEKLGRCLGCEGDMLQVEALRLFESELDAGIEKALAKKEENSRLVKALSTLVGILCIVLFL